tara:strand:- start:1294 stop:1599 length:306 start_codon:yes stop_codon:yes gene_type:complete
MSNRLKNLYIESLKNHDWNYENHDDDRYIDGQEEKMFLRSIINEAYELDKDPAMLFYKHCPEHLYKFSADYGIRTPWKEILLQQNIKQEIAQEKYKQDVKH